MAVRGHWKWTVQQVLKHVQLQATFITQHRHPHWVWSALMYLINEEWVQFWGIIVHRASKTTKLHVLRASSAPSLLVALNCLCPQMLLRFFHVVIGKVMSAKQVNHKRDWRGACEVIVLHLNFPDSYASLCRISSSVKMWSSENIHFSHVIHYK